MIVFFFFKNYDFKSTLEWLDSVDRKLLDILTILLSHCLFDSDDTYPLREFKLAELTSVSLAKKLAMELLCTLKLHLKFHTDVT